MRVRTPVAADEQLARFVLFSKWFRSDATVRPEAFMPHPHVDLSVTRHQSLSEQEIWAIGQGVAAVRGVPLYGRADICVADILRQSLKVVAAPVQSNPNHANVIDWPEQKPAQKIIALQLAAAAKYLSKP
jgi:hypothetical protein